jgi:hypothetical protein
MRIHRGKCLRSCGTYCDVRRTPMTAISFQVPCNNEEAHLFPSDPSQKTSPWRCDAVDNRKIRSFFNLHHMRTALAGLIKSCVAVSRVKSDIWNRLGRHTQEAVLLLISEEHLRAEVWALNHRDLRNFRDGIRRSCWPGPDSGFPASASCASVVTWLCECS